MIILASLIRYELHCDLTKEIAGCQKIYCKFSKRCFSWCLSKRLNKKISVKKSVEEETVLLASDVPALGVKSDHPSELDKV